MDKFKGVTINFDLNEYLQRWCKANFKEFTQECIDDAIEKVENIPIVDKQGNCIGVAIDGYHGILYNKIGVEIMMKENKKDMSFEIQAVVLRR